MRHQTTKSYSTCGSRTALYLHRATLGLIPKSCRWLPLSLKGFMGLGFHFLVKTITLAFKEFNVKPLVSNNLCTVFRALISKNIKFPLTNWLCHLHSHKPGNLPVLSPLRDCLPQGTTKMEIKTPSLWTAFNRFVFYGCIPMAVNQVPVHQHVPYPVHIRFRNFMSNHGLLHCHHGGAIKSL